MKRLLKTSVFARDNTARELHLSLARPMEEKLEGPPGLDVMTSAQVSTDPTTDGQRRARVTVKFLPLINRQQSKGEPFHYQLPDNDSN